MKKDRVCTYTGKYVFMVFKLMNDRGRCCEFFIQVINALFGPEYLIIYSYIYSSFKINFYCHNHYFTCMKQRQSLHITRQVHFLLFMLMNNKKRCCEFFISFA